MRPIPLTRQLTYRVGVGLTTVVGEAVLVVKGTLLLVDPAGSVASEPGLAWQPNRSAKPPDIGPYTKSRHD